MTEILRVHAFLEHSFPKDEELFPKSLKDVLIHQHVHIPYHSIPVYRDGMTGELMNPDINFKRSCSTVTYPSAPNENKVESSLMKSIEEISRQSLSSVKKGFPFQNCIYSSSDDSSANLMSVHNILSRAMEKATDSVFHKWCYPKGYFTDCTAQLDETGSFSLPKTQKVTLLKRRVRASRPRQSYAVKEDTVTRLPPLKTIVPNPALDWEFEPDTFQKRAILCLENNQTVFVAAHTSSGKTAIAEYACAICLRRGSRVIYTSPVKALSNQKFYDFRKKFNGNVGLVTGDIKLAPEAPLLIMTTEVLHNMLCSSSEMIKDLEIVVLDEVHYINDPERGYVWEQIMIMLPKHVLLVMLSASVPNHLELAEWLGQIRGCEIHVIATETRPVPLEHFLYTGKSESATGDLMHRIVSQTNDFDTVGYSRAVASYSNQKMLSVPFRNSNKTEFLNELNKNMWLGLIRVLKESDLMPVIAFGFSRKALETLAKNVLTVDLLDFDEKERVNQLLKTLVNDRLRKCDRRLASVQFIRELASKGLAFHHAGLMPLLKETVEMLFQRGLVKILFATETFSMGVNMPARSVVFTSLSKFDGQTVRPLTSTEYTQMAGRAGRRGLDTKGNVIILVGSLQKVLRSNTGLPSEYTLMSIILGKQTNLVSKFKITYPMILQLHRLPGFTPEEVMRRSFMEAASHRKQMEHQQSLSLLNKKLNETTVFSVSSESQGDDLILQVKCPHDGIACCKSVVDYHKKCLKYYELYRCILNNLLDDNQLKTLICPGRLIFIQLPLSTLQSQSDTFIYSEEEVYWLVPAILVDSSFYMKDKGKVCDLITWTLPVNLPDAPPSYISEDETQQVNQQSTPDIYESKDQIEENLLRREEPNYWSKTPIPPQLLPLFIPSSLEDAYSCLTLKCNVPVHLVVRFCDQVVKSDFGSNENSKFTSNMDISHRFTKAMELHKQIMNTTLKTDKSAINNSDPRLVLLNQVNTTLFNSVNSPNLKLSSPKSTISGILRSMPKHLDFDQVVNDYGNKGENTSILDEYAALSDELTTSLSNLVYAQNQSLYDCPNLSAHLYLAHRTFRRRQTVEKIKKSLADFKLTLDREYTGRLNILKELKFINSTADSCVLSLKGLVACELTKREVIITELLFDGLFDDLLAPQIAAVLSAFVNEMRQSTLTSQLSHDYLHNLLREIHSDNWDSKSDLNYIPNHLIPVFKKILNFVYKLEIMQRQHQLAESYSDTRLDLCPVTAVYKWANGHSLYAATSKCDLPEGLLIKILLQLDELIRHICGVCRQIGNHDLCLKMEEAKSLIYRDIVCAPSLYVTEK
ncbi:unnamed protein product [Trichobilharzia szidati]|nr:unnamed protein product [Trichobilharzia szidati]